MAFVKKSNDRNYPIAISDSWSPNDMYLTVEQAEELIKDLKEIIKKIEKNT